MTTELIVLNSHGQDAMVFDTTDYSLLRTIDIGGHPDEIAYLGDGSLLISRRHSDDLLALDPKSGEHLWTVPTSGNPHHITMAPGGLVYVPLFNRQELEVVSIADRKVVDRITVGWGGHGAFTSASGERVYVGSCFEDKISVIDVATNTVERELQFPEGVRPFSIARDESRLYVQLSKMHGFVIYDLREDRVTAQISLPEPPLGPGPWLRFPHTVNHGLALTPDEEHLIVAGSSTKMLYVYKVPDLSLVASIPVGDEPNWITMNDDDRVAYVSNREDDTVSVVSLDTWTEVRRLEVGDYPQRMGVLRA